MKFPVIGKSLRSRIVIFYTALIIVILSAAFMILNTMHWQAAEQQAKQELATGSRIFQRLLANNTEQLVKASTVLTADFGFRRAAATADKETILSVLENHGGRVGADMMMLVALDGTILADTYHPGSQLIPLPMQELIAKAKQMGEASSHVVIDKKVFQATVLPVMAPDIIAWVVLGFVIDEKFTEQLKALTNLHISFISVTDGELSIPASTLPKAEQVALRSLLAAQDSLMSWIALEIFNHGNYFTQLTEVAATNSTRSFAVLQRSMTDSYDQMSQLRNLLVMLALISIIVSFIGIVFIANSVTRPLRMLADVADKISNGDYNSAANIAESGEIGLLAASFNVMQSSITTLLRLAYRDQLTDLPNRAMFNDRISQAIDKAHRHNEKFTLLFMDLNKFKAINDTYGHEAGDIVLKTVGQRLKETLRETDTIARLGGDEFAVILLQAAPDAINSIVSKIQSGIEKEPIDIGENSVYVGCSIGASTYLEHGTTAKQLMHAADQAMYLVKQSKEKAIGGKLPLYLDVG